MLEIRLVSSLEKVGIGQDPIALDGEAPVYVFRGETASFQIAFRDTAASGGEAGETAPAMDERGSDGIREKTTLVSCHGIKVDERYEESSDVQNLGVRIRHVLPVLCRRSCNPDSVDEDYLFYDSRKAPDILRDLNSGKGVPVTKEWQSFWVDICPGKEAKAGCHTVSISVKQIEGDAAYYEKADAGNDVGEENACSSAGHAETGGADSPIEKPDADSMEMSKSYTDVRIKIQVIDTELPKLSIPHTEWFHCDGIID